MSGIFFAVVGPSGAGKDTVIEYARQRMRNDPRLIFPSRYITRPPEAGGEEHTPVSPQEFKRIKSSGGFLLDWRAHGLSYGIPATVSDQLANGISVVANLSRAAIGQLRECTETVEVVLVTAPAEIIAKRLAARGREDTADIARRLERADYDLPDGLNITTISNAGSIAAAGTVFVELLNRKMVPLA